MNLRNIDYQEDYRSGHDDILEDLFRPSLARSSEYWRAVGYFSSSAFRGIWHAAWRVREGWRERQAGHVGNAVKEGS